MEASRVGHSQTPSSWSERGAAPELAQPGGTQRGLQAQTSQPLAFGRAGGGRATRGCRPEAPCSLFPAGSRLFPAT
ncbi:unnamed protein product [Rangifer tarandus platyrhynchus]|uniref:Uncharacterized protein n=2 Tax=Rangifer tarandus platyrhynchus TaxID=3082113 RepID=A0ACB0DU09_RANTA|nr:unnamed protein product [Rangifer tarandus platyrhynchus]CAI9691698.1 unnamed protein product [Rangifer tarandus platyrhynchus]